MNLTQNHIHQSNLIEGYDDPEFDKQLWVAWELLQNKQVLTEDVVRKVQKIATLRQTDLRPDERGYTRSMSKVNVHVGDHVAPSWWLVDGMLSNWLMDMAMHMETLDPREMHVRFEHIHPFVDGNGRTGRLLMWWHEIKQGKEPLLINFEDRWGYYEWFTKK